MNTREHAMALVYAGNGVHDFLGRRVEAAVVDAEADTAIVLLREEHACAERGVGWLDPAITGVLVQLGFDGFVLGRVYPADPVTREGGSSRSCCQRPGKVGGLEEGPRG